MSGLQTRVGDEAEKGDARVILISRDVDPDKPDGDGSCARRTNEMIARDRGNPLTSA
jgi:hypothetical protein